MMDSLLCALHRSPHLSPMWCTANRQADHSAAVRIFTVLTLPCAQRCFLHLYTLVALRSHGGCSMVEHTGWLSETYSTRMVGAIETAHWTFLACSSFLEVLSCRSLATTWVMV